MASRPEGDVSEAKHELRLEMRRRRAKVAPATRADFATALPDLLSNHLEETEQRSRLAAVALYCAKGDEAPAESLLELTSDHGFIAYPRVVDRERMVFHRVSDPSELELGLFGVREPTPASPVVLPGALRLIAIPGLAFDRRGGRLGWGRGYYDSALLEHPDALRVGIAYSTQLIDAVPTDEWDVAVDLIITEEGIIQCKPCI